MSKNSRIAYTCRECGKHSPKWLGHCPDCQSWNTFEETKPSTKRGGPPVLLNPALELSMVETEDKPRLAFRLHELNRVLGGGMVPGSLVLISGDPGIGKSTLLLQASSGIAGKGSKVVYVSGEESPYQTKLRGDRLGLKGHDLYLVTETNMDAILQHLQDLSPALAVIDSIQTVYLPESPGAPGSVSQVRECTVSLMQWAKSASIPVLIAGHVTKDGSIAGPKVLEHIVDVVLYMEGESLSTYRLLRGMKNRFGSTNEIGIFEMRGDGLVEVENPSLVFLSQRSQPSTGSVVSATLEGTRPLLVEVQALTSTTNFGLPRRTASGIDLNRLLLIIAVLNKRAGLSLANQDVIINVVGGLRVNEPAMDLAIALSIASSFSDRYVEPDLIALGEIGLNGEVRPVPQMERRLAEAARQGFRRCVAPANSASDVRAPSGMEVTGVTSLREALSGALRGRQQSKH